VREYAPGDDVRTIDWNVTQYGAPYVKQFQEERDSRCCSWSDQSDRRGSARDGLKGNSAAEVGAVLRAFRGAEQRR